MSEANRDDTPETVLTECRHATEAKWTDEDGDIVRIDVSPEGDVAIKAPNRQPAYISAELFRAIKHVVARHDAANTEPPSPQY